MDALHLGYLTAEIFAGLLVLAVVLATSYVVWKRGVFQVQQEALDNFKTALEGEKACREQLEGRVDALELELAARDRQIAKLEGVIQGKDHSMRDWAKAVAESGICAIAFECKDRRLPIEDERG